MPEAHAIPHAPDLASSRDVLPHGTRVTAHRHRQGQLLYSAFGVLATTTERGTWVAPADRITWTPPGFYHYNRVYGETEVSTLGVPRDLCGTLPEQPTVFVVTSLLREALLALTGGQERQPEARDRLLRVVLDELTETPEQSVYLPEPADDRLQAVSNILYADPALNSTLAELGHRVGASERTLSRLFQSELGMSFHQWRSLLRIQHSLVHLLAGKSVTETAMLCGWSNPTSFIAAFTAVVGQTPGRYLADIRYQAA